MQVLISPINYYKLSIEKYDLALSTSQKLVIAGTQQVKRRRSFFGIFFESSAHREYCNDPSILNYDNIKLEIIRIYVVHNITINI